MELRTPLGCRDILSRDVRKRKLLVRRILLAFDSFGFEEVSTPALEYYQTYNQAFASLQDQQMLKMIDENNDILALRLDMTVPIARLAATTLKNVEPPLRLSYSSDVWKRRKAFSGRASQSSDCGVELIGSADDCEILICALNALEASGLENWTLEISDVRLVEEPARKIFENDEDIARLSRLIGDKSMVELEEFLDSFDLKDEIRSYFLSLPMLGGDPHALEDAAGLVFDEQTGEVLRSLAQLYDFLEALGWADKIRFDLGKLPHYNYYTGLIFEAFVAGASSAVLSGGRYDHLMEKFGVPMPAVGFALKIDPLCELIEEEERPGLCVIAYPPHERLQAFELAGRKRKTQAVVLKEDHSLSTLEMRWEERP